VKCVPWAEILIGKGQTLTALPMTSDYNPCASSPSKECFIFVPCSPGFLFAANTEDYAALHKFNSRKEWPNRQDNKNKMAWKLKLFFFQNGVMLLYWSKNISMKISLHSFSWIRIRVRFVVAQFSIHRNNDVESGVTRTSKRGYISLREPKFWERKKLLSWLYH